MARLLRLWAPLVAFQALLFVCSSRSTLPVEVSHWDKAVHFGAYACLAVLWVRVFPGWPRSIGLKGAAAAAALTVLFGISDEYHQSFVPGRDASAADLLADGLGAVFAVTCLLMFLKARGGRRGENAPFDGI